jgi:hypothetical protein
MSASEVTTGWTIEEFCKGAKIARPTLYTIPEAARPKMTRIGRRVIITESPLDWLRRIGESGAVTTSRAAA